METGHVLNGRVPATRELYLLVIDTQWRLGHALPQIDF